MSDRMTQLKEQWKRDRACCAGARRVLRGHWVDAVLVAAMAATLSATSPGSPWVSYPADALPIVFIPQNMKRLLRDVFGLSIPTIRWICVGILVAGFLLHGALKVGQARFNLALVDGKPVTATMLFSGFRGFWRALVMHLLTKVLTTLGYLLLVVPGVILNLGFSMAPCVLAEDPGCSCWEALKRSWAMMQGRKLELWWMEAAFYVCKLLAGLTYGVGELFLDPYTAAARACFYRSLNGNPEN